MPRARLFAVLLALVATGVFFTSEGVRPLPRAPYRDASLPVDVRVEDLLGRMTAGEKIGQLALVEKNSVVDASDIARYGIGALLSGGGGNPEPNTPEAWLAMVDDFQRAARDGRLGIPLLYGVDAVHGHSNVLGATIFPHALGLGATRRILRAGLFDAEPARAAELPAVGSADHRAVAREAVRKSLVRLKDAGTLPLDKNLSRVVVAGSSANNLGRQSGGWTVEWQGVDGNWIPGTTILDGIRNAVGEHAEIEYSATASFSARAKRADVGIVVVGEAPYAEGAGDNERPELSAEDLLAIANVRAASERIVVVIVSGRPIDIRPYVASWDAVVAAWLPGSEGDGVADVLFGDYPFAGTLPVDWPL